MEQTKYQYFSVAVTEDTKAEIRRIAKEKRRSLSQQAGELLELGLNEYARREEQAADIAAGKTQINTEAINGRR